MSAPIDRKIERRSSITIAAELARSGNGEAAIMLRDMYELAKAYQKINIAYRTGSRKGLENAIDTATRLAWLLDLK